MTGALDRYGAWVAGTALPFWADAGFDARAGRFRERLDRDGRPIAVPHRAMVQARQIYVFSTAARLGLFPAGGALAEAAAAALVRDFVEEGPRGASVAFSVHPDGDVASPLRDAYAHAFVLFALAALHRLTGDAAPLRLAARIATFVEQELEDRAGGGLPDPSSRYGRTKRQNPVMHLLEAYLALERAAPGTGGWLARAGRLVALLHQRLLHPEAGVLLEHFAEDWGPHPDPARAAVFEPGHHFEWVWLLADYAELTGADVAAVTEQLYTCARARGLAPSGLVRDELSADFAVTGRSSRLWPHTEAIKAAAAMRGRDPGARAFAEAMAGTLAASFLDRPFAGGWIDQVDEDGRPLVDDVPASALYHLFLAADVARGAFGAGAPQDR